MNELEIFASGILFGVIMSVGLLRYGMGFATKLIEQARYNIAPEKFGTPIEQEFSGDEEAT